MAFYTLRQRGGRGGRQGNRCGRVQCVRLWRGGRTKEGWLVNEVFQGCVFVCLCERVTERQQQVVAVVPL